MTDPKSNSNAVNKDPEAVVRMVARAVIRRVQNENPDCFGKELRLRLSAANPFTAEDHNLELIWQEEICWALLSQNATLN